MTSLTLFLVTIGAFAASANLMKLIELLDNPRNAQRSHGAAR
jgi:hypothetical protein